MAKRPTPPSTISHDFTFASEADLKAQITAFQTSHAVEHEELLAMHDRRSLGAGKVRVTFRVRSKKGR